jgi:hypothetical protein
MFHSLTAFGDLRCSNTSCWRRRKILGLKPSSSWVRNATIGCFFATRPSARHPG